MTAESSIDTKGDGINSYQNATLSSISRTATVEVSREREMRTTIFQFHAGKGDPKSSSKGPVNEKFVRCPPVETKVLSVQTVRGAPVR